MRTGDLTTLERVKEWLNTGPTPESFPANDDQLLGRLITAASTWAQTFMNRSVPPSDYTQKFNGVGGSMLFLPKQPVLGVTAVTVDGVAVSAQVTPPLSLGFAFDERQLYYVGGSFNRGLQNITVQYSAGFQQTDEAAVIASTQLKLSALAFPWNKDRGVKLADGTVLTRVDDAPADGEYKLDTSTEPFVYQFNGAQEGEDILVSYGYTPVDMEQVVVELIGERYKTRTRIGQTSVNFGNGQVVSFTNKDANDNCKMVLNNYSLRGLLP